LYLGNWPEGARRFKGGIDELYVTNNILHTSDFSPEFEYDNVLPNSLGLWHFNEGNGIQSINTATSQQTALNNWSWVSRSSARITSSSSYLWSTGATTASINVKPLVSTLYYVSNTIGNTTCRDSINVAVQNAFAYNALPDTIKAFKDSVILDAGAGYQAYLWSDGSSAQTLAAKSTGSYKVYVTNGSGQMAMDQIYVKIVDANIIQNDLTICKPDSVTLSIDTTYFSTGLVTNPPPVAGPNDPPPFNDNQTDKVDSTKFNPSFRNIGNFNIPYGNVHKDYQGNIIVSGSYTGAVNVDGNTTKTCTHKLPVKGLQLICTAGKRSGRRFAI
jgi:hypothetical protein